MINKNGVLFHTSFTVFSRQCEVQIETQNEKLAEDLLGCITYEFTRIADKYSLDASDNIMSLINRGTAESIIVDEETAGLIDFADACFQLSEGRFDITLNSKFDVNSGWHRIRWDNPRLRLLQGMNLNFNCFIKSHACDRAMTLANEIAKCPILINLDGHIIANKPRISTGDWWVEHLKNTSHTSARSMQFTDGGIVTLYSNPDKPTYLDGRCGEPISNNPLAITVAAPNCTEAGMLATLAMLYGDQAEKYLTEQQALYWIEQAN